jgi:pyruvate,orthophosphate dikinase
MSVSSNIHYFSHTETNIKDIPDKMGIRGKRAVELAQLGMPIVPGIIFDSDIASKLGEYQLKDELASFCKRNEEETGKKFNSADNPAILKIVISPALEIISFPSIHTIGLTDKTIAGFQEMVGEHFAHHEYAKFLIRSTVSVMAKTSSNENEKSQLNKFIKKIEKASSLAAYKKIIEEAKTILPRQFFNDAYYQLEFLLKKVSLLLNIEEMDDEDTAIIVQAMVYGNYGKESYSGRFYTRDIVNGKAELQGSAFQDKFDETSGGKMVDINKISANYKTELEKIADKIERYFKEIRLIKFTIERGKLWIIEQSTAMVKSTQAELKCLLYLYSKKEIDDTYIIKTIKPQQMSDILHPIINQKSIGKMKSIPGGISGAPGAATGRIYFSTERLMDAHQRAIADKQDARVILCLPATYAEDVKAIENSTGVLSNEGGYAAHASVVARQYGKVSLVNNDLKIDTKKGQAVIGSNTIKEGDYVTLDVPYYGDPQILLGKAQLIEPDPKESGLLDFIQIISKHIGDFKVLGNADTPKDAGLVKLFGGEGIGLCRTEHMFFGDDRINVFREMIMAGSPNERKKSLKTLLNMQMKDFYGIFKNMNPYPVTIRLLDAPLHEFLPHTDDELKDFIAYLKKTNPKVSAKDVEYKIEMIEEVNPMLGHRGCRIAVTYPEIYEMQVTAILAAAYKLRSEGINVVPEIMIPIIMNTQEVKFIKHGKKIEGTFIKGIVQIEKEVRKKLNEKKPIDYKVGTMIELPAAALQADKIAQYAEFFSFGTNDLTQTTHGLSRDDFNTFLPDYTQFDLLDGNPFQLLTQPVQELIGFATERGRITRPDLKIGLCGEQGADPRNLEFLRNAGLNYVSCSSYSIPIAKLAIAQLVLEEEDED